MAYTHLVNRRKKNDIYFPHLEKLRLKVREYFTTKNLKCKILTLYKGYGTKLACNLLSLAPSIQTWLLRQKILRGEKMWNQIFYP